MQVFSVKDVERVLRIPRSAIHSLVRGGFVAPARGRRRQYEFSFQDLVALRTARALMLARVSPRRISQALRQLRRPEEVAKARGKQISEVLPYKRPEPEAEEVSTVVEAEADAGA